VAGKPELRPNPAWDGRNLRPGFEDHPVTCVNWDWADAYKRGDLTPPTEGGGLWRGGSSRADAGGIRTTTRGGNVRGCGFPDLGFRVAKSAEPANL
jgi:formylglycine-generating enzyme required for sulfatase activity